MKFIKKNIKIIVGFIVGVILASGITVYATYKYFATDVSYIKDGTEISVEDALNELYANLNLELEFVISNSVTGTLTTNRTASVDLSSGNYIIFANEYNAGAPTTGLNTSITLSSSDANTIINMLSSKVSSYETAYSSSSNITIFQVQSNNNFILTILGNDAGKHSTAAAGLNYIIYKVK